MNTHPIDPIALVSGLFFGLAGLAILADRQWEDVNVTAFTAAGVMLIGLLLLGLIVTRYVQSSTNPTDPAENPDT
jgi:predicted transporter